jgi:exopolysaccharide biosynthesis polyprenyl glycosylphosphotransferase
MSMREAVRGWSLVTLSMAFLDICYILVAYSVAVWLTLPVKISVITSFIHHIGLFFIFSGFWCWVAVDRGLWEKRGGGNILAYFPLIVRAVTGAMVFSVFVTVSVTDLPISREFLAVFCIATMIFLPLFRALFQGAMLLLHVQGIYSKSILVVGANPRSANLVSLLNTHPVHGCKVEGFLDDDLERRPILEGSGAPWLGRFDDLETTIREKGISEVLIALPIRSYSDIVDQMARTCDDCGVSAHFLTDLFPLKIAKSNLLYMEDIPLLSLSTIPESPGELALKRALDLLVSSVLLLALFPVFIGTAITIKLDSPGPVFFLQDRAGRNGRRFRMIKFRSMRQDAEKMREELEKFNQVDGPAFKMKNDPRVTPVGRFIRKYSIDELPQLINVWLGEMSLVGPRPPLMHHAEQYTWDQRRRLSVKPGMTGLWQVSGRSDIGFEEWLEMDLSYIDTWSFVQDLVILVRTIPAVLRGRGAV